VPILGIWGLDDIDSGRLNAKSGFVGLSNLNFICEGDDAGKRSQEFNRFALSKAPIEGGRRVSHTAKLSVLLLKALAPRDLDYPECGYR